MDFEFGILIRNIFKQKMDFTFFLFSFAYRGEQRTKIIFAINDEKHSVRTDCLTKIFAKVNTWSYNNMGFL